MLVLTPVETELGAWLRFAKIYDQRRHVAGGKSFRGYVACGNDSVLDVGASDSVAVDPAQRCRTSRLTGVYVFPSLFSNASHREIPGKEVQGLRFQV